jgi:hypothetical protein
LIEITHFSSASAMDWQKIKKPLIECRKYAKEDKS